MSYLASRNHELLNLDFAAPLEETHRGSWRNVDILEAEAVKKEFEEFQPHAVIHLAARTDCDENTTVEHGYRANTEGTGNVLAAITRTGSVERVIITSSQFVCGPGYAPENDEDFYPVTVYGESKVQSEKMTREAHLRCCWTVVRPTNIWGPWHPRYVREFWKIAEKGLYIHPGGEPVVRCYGYVGNIVRWFERILEADVDVVNGKVFYLSDPAADIYEWANAFCLALNGRPAPRVPRSLLGLLARAGDVISAIQRKPFYLTSSRYRSMTSNYEVPGALAQTYALLGAPLFTMRHGVDETVHWLRTRL
jgi:GlcNAc-P-P-Und epimerase